MATMASGTRRTTGTGERLKTDHRPPDVRSVSHNDRSGWMRNFGVNSSPRHAFRGRTTGRTGCSGSTARNPSYSDRQVPSLRGIGRHGQKSPNTHTSPSFPTPSAESPWVSDPSRGIDVLNAVGIRGKPENPRCLQTASSPFKAFGKNDHAIAIGIKVGDVSRRRIAALLIKAPRRFVFRGVRGFDQQQPATAGLYVAFGEL